jgi:hypothetical protein
MQPKQYPANDYLEQKAKTVLESLVDGHFVKLDIKTRDKAPNVDGTIELVNAQTIPLGKFDVQLKAIPKGYTSYSCSTSLPAYSKVSILPCLLICVDIENECAYWKHITQFMPELKGKEVQETFTIHFIKGSDEIDQSRVYIRKWLEIVNTYQLCVEQYPSFGEADIKKLEPLSIEKDELLLFQKFIDTVNNLLDNDFAIIKDILFPGIWKLGVGIIDSSKHHIQYQIYSIPYKEPAPLVCKLNRGFLFTNKWDKNAIVETKTSKVSLIDPQLVGKEFIKERVEAVIKSQLLPIYGEKLSSDILFNFVDQYHVLLGLKPFLSQYTTQELSISLNRHLFSLAEACLANQIPISSKYYNVDLDKLASYIRTNNNVAHSNNKDRAFTFTIGTNNFPISTVNSSLKFLIAKGIREINRHFGLRDLPLASGASWIWSGYSKENEINSATYILKNSLNEYKTLVEGNKFKFAKSHYLSPDTTVILEYECISGSKYEEGPGLHEYIIDNTSHTLPKLVVYSKEKNSPSLKVGSVPEESYYTVEYLDKTYKAYSITHSVSSFLFSSTPLLNHVYQMLLHDLNENYGMNMFTATFL